MTLHELLDTADNLSVAAMSVRAGMVFIATLICLRIAGRRSFGQGSAFDMCLMVLLGAILSRAVVGAFAMLPTLAASLVIVLLHRVLGMLTIRFPRLDELVSGRARTVVENGVKNDGEMKAGLISVHDVLVAARKKGHLLQAVDEVKLAILERDGKITVLQAPPRRP